VPHFFAVLVARREAARPAPIIRPKEQFARVGRVQELEAGVLLFWGAPLLQDAPA